MYHLKNLEMKKLLIPVIFIAPLTITTYAQSSEEVGVMKFQEGQVQHVVMADDITWNPCPPHLPEGCEITILEGDPKSDGMFTVRFQTSKGFLMPPHTHPKDERVTIISGKVSVAFGADATHDDAKTFGPGDYYVNKRGEIHTVWADENSVLQITGIGPWKADFIE
jgi:quercetin dioxygenase-like cupin family protein